jgi:hypothetical protein
MYIEVEANPNCAGREGMRYRELGPPSPVVRVRIFDRRDEGEWCLVTAVQGEGATPWGPALARRVEDSGVGVAYLVFGGAWGIRLCPVDRARPSSVTDECCPPSSVTDECCPPWSLDDPDQWGEPYLVLTDPQDLVIEEPG